MYFYDLNVWNLLTKLVQDKKVVVEEVVGTRQESLALHIIGLYTSYSVLLILRHIQINLVTSLTLAV